ncbi:hypothetical protein BC939DRAFT_449195 [Gamsiella multidivaricata]|uniref:uncharacterized protein n=1 Tax=Gamsiella multidivaricata TaxID=101098 RepID=UPI002220824B|nr:uncharacterized protein BC939DRAFT_449195 [Gamsiella multidivaricata]KAG0370317.1 hypothetical protein BGZ54_006893 [Gamsiella multidivaricata]KAI7824768.1 hypothetical protein BC939DRAFT_449195 [Gamsiella multidivaricata]
MSTARRKQTGRSNALAQSTANQVLSGAEMLVLQQNIKQYIITSQTRALTAHELEEFVKIKELLLPCLLRYSQPAGPPLIEEPTTSGNSISISGSRQEKVASSQPSGKAAASSQSPSRIYPATQPRSSAAKTDSRTPSKPSQSKAKSAMNPKRTPIVTSAPLHPSASLNLVPASTQSTSARGLVASSIKKGDRKRPKMEVYQDPENVQKKRPRLKAKNNGEDSDKENRDPHVIDHPRRKVLGNNTNIVNKTTRVSDPKGKGAIRNPDATKNNTKATITSELKSTPKAQQQSGLYSTPASTIALATKNPNKRAKVASVKKEPVQERLAIFTDNDRQATGTDQLPTPSQEQTTEVPDAPEAPATQLLRQPAKEKESEIWAKEVPISLSSASRKVPTTNTRQFGTGAIEILPSVEDDAVDNDLDVFIKTECSTSTVKARIGSVGYEEIPNSQGSEDDLYSIQGSQEEKAAMRDPLTADASEDARDDEEEATFPAPGFLMGDVLDDQHEEATIPAPNFLLDDALEDQNEEERTLPAPGFLLDDVWEDQQQEEEATFPAPGFLLGDVSEDQQEEAEATVPMPGFLLRDLPEEPVDDQAGSESTSDARDTRDIISKMRPDLGNAVIQSTNFSDGVWCIDDYTGEVSSVICGNKERWIAVETTSHVEFWQLQDFNTLPESRWRRCVQVKKASSCPIQVMFAPDDSFAVVLSSQERSFVKVSLEDIGDLNQLGQPQCCVTWRGPKPFLSCHGVIAERQDHQGSPKSVAYQLVFGVDEPGTICLIPIPDGDLKSMSTSPQKVCYPSNKVASSIVKVRNTTSLILCSFGTNIVLWDLQRPSEPVSTVNTASVLSILPSPVLTASAMMPSIVSATVPAQFFKECNDVLQPDSVLPSDQPILTILKMCDTEVGDSEQMKGERCGLYVMKGDSIELVHKYKGSESISFAYSSPRFVACQTKSDGKDSLCLWDIRKPNAVLELALLDAPSQREIGMQHQSLLLQQNLQKSEKGDGASNVGKDDEQKDKADMEYADIFSSQSTLSSPPADLSSSPSTSSEDNRTVKPNASETTPQAPTEPLNRHPERVKAEERQVRQPTEWIELTSVSWTGHKRVQFSMQAEQHWAVVVQQDIARRNPSVIHIIDLMSILPMAHA